jgi:hypothetical protein
MFLPNPFPETLLNSSDRIWELHPSHLISKGKHKFRGEKPFSIDVKGGEVANKGIIADTRKVAGMESIKID